MLLRCSRRDLKKILPRFSISSIPSDTEKYQQKTTSSVRTETMCEMLPKPGNVLWCRNVGSQKSLASEWQVLGP